MQLNAKVTGLEGLNMAIAATEKSTKRAAGGLVISGTFAFVKSARAATPKPKFRNRSPHKFGKGKAFYMVRSHKRKDFRAFFPTGKSKKAIPIRKAVQKKYRKIRGYGFAKVSWLKMFGKVAQQSTGEARMLTTPKGAQFEQFSGETHKPEKYIKATARGFRLVNPTMMLSNKVEYIEIIAPGLVEHASRMASLSMLRGKANEGLRHDLQKVWGLK
jgi:hypothetical protein